MCHICGGIKFKIDAAACLSSMETRIFLPQLLGILFNAVGVAVCYDWLEVSMETGNNLIYMPLRYYIDELKGVDVMFGSSWTDVVQQQELLQLLLPPPTLPRSPASS